MGAKRIHLNTSAKPKVILALSDMVTRKTLENFLLAQNFQVSKVYYLENLTETILQVKPRLIITDFLLPSRNALSLLPIIKGIRTQEDQPCELVVVSRQKQTLFAESLMRKGALKHLSIPLDPKELNELSAKLQSPANPVVPTTELKKQEIETLTGDNPESDDTMALVPRGLEIKQIQLLVQRLLSPNDHVNIWQYVTMLSLKFEALRCSFIKIENEMSGRVMASNDDQSLKNLKISLFHYPELTEVFKTGEPLIIQDWRHSNLFLDNLNVQKKLEVTPFTSFLVFPIKKQNQVVAMISARLPRKTMGELRYLTEFGSLSASLLSFSAFSE